MEIILNPAAIPVEGKAVVVVQNFTELPLGSA